MNYLRQLSHHIEEPVPGEFYWVILESKDDQSAPVTEPDGTGNVTPSMWGHPLLLPTVDWYDVD